MSYLNKINAESPSGSAKLEKKMGKQYNKLEKRARRKRYLDRVKLRIKAAMKHQKKK